MNQPRIAVVTADEKYMVTPDGELPYVIRALGDRGMIGVAEQWQDPTVDWASYDLVVLKSPWDYTLFANEFKTWLLSTSRLTSILNCAHVVAWNLNKSYLGQLAELGVPVVPTKYVSRSGELAAAFDEFDGQEIVVKPSVSAGARDTGRFAPNDPKARELAARILAGDKVVMIQPAIESVATQGEHALLYFNGEYSHAIVKGPILELGGGFVSGSYRETVTKYEPTAAERAVAEKVLSNLPQILQDGSCNCPDPTPLYARIDLVNSEDGPLLLEAELFEPSLFFEVDPPALVRYVEAITARLS